MQVSNTVASQQLQSQSQTSVIKEALKLNEIVVKELLQKGLQSQPQPPKNYQGNISLYA